MVQLYSFYSHQTTLTFITFELGSEPDLVLDVKRNEPLKLEIHSQSTIFQLHCDLIHCHLSSEDNDMHEIATSDIFPTILMQNFPCNLGSTKLIVSPFSTS